MEYLIAFFAGTFVGSFLNVVIYRVPRKLSIIYPPSSCPHCGHRIKPWFNVPLFGWLLLRGKCRDCHTAISWTYPLVEFLGGLTALLSVYHFGRTSSALVYAFFAWVLLAVAFIDFRTRLIPNSLVITLLAGGIALNLAAGFIAWGDAGLGLLAGGGSMFLLALGAERLFGREALGMGDVKLAAAAGFFLGWKTILVALYLGFVLAFVAIILGKLYKRQRQDAYLPLGPFLTISFIAFVYWGQQIWQWYWHWVIN